VLVDELDSLADVERIAVANFDEREVELDLLRLEFVAILLQLE
jgi:hypothetical protein